MLSDAVNPEQDAFTVICRQRFDQFSAAVSIILLQWEAELSILSPEMDIKIWCPCMRTQFLKTWSFLDFLFIMYHTPAVSIPSRRHSFVLYFFAGGLRIA